jgi:hypothetical protein
MTTSEGVTKQTEISPAFYIYRKCIQRADKKFETIIGRAGFIWDEAK